MGRLNTVRIVLVVAAFAFAAPTAHAGEPLVAVLDSYCDFAYFVDGDYECFWESCQNRECDPDDTGRDGIIIRTFL